MRTPRIHRFLVQTETDNKQLAGDTKNRIEGDLSCTEMDQNHCIIHNDLGRRFLAEFLGTCIFVMVASGCLAQIILGSHSTFTEDSTPLYFIVTVGEGLGLALGTYVAFAVSGGHLNPAVSFAVAVAGHLKTSELCVYVLAQHLGAFAAACGTYAVYADAFTAFRNSSDNEDAGASVFASFPQVDFSLRSQLVSILTNSAFFMVVFLAATDPYGLPKAKKSIAPGIIGFALTGVGLSLGLACGTALNPARDLTGRLFSVMLGWDFFLDRDTNLHWYWMPAVVPYFGSVLGMVIYYLFVGNHWPVSRNKRSSFLDSNALLIQNKIYRPRTISTADVRICY